MRHMSVCITSRRQSKIGHKSGLNGDNSLFIMVTTQKNIHILKSKLQHNSFFRVGSILQTPWNLSVHISPGTSNLLSCRMRPERVGHWAWLWHILLLYIAYFIAESGFEIIIIHATCKGSFLHYQLLLSRPQQAHFNLLQPSVHAGCPYTPPRYPPLPVLLSTALLGYFPVLLQPRSSLQSGFVPLERTWRGNYPASCACMHPANSSPRAPNGRWFGSRHWSRVETKTSSWMLIWMK